MRNINKHNKTLTLKLKTYFSMVLLICAAVCGMFLVNGNAFASTSQPEVKVFDEGIKYFTTYGIGETIFIKKINVQINGEDVDVFAYLQKDNEIIEKLTPNNNMVCHVFEEKGKYQLVYFTKNDDLSQETIKKYSFTVNSQPYFKVEFAPSYVVGSVINVDGKCFYDLQSVNSAVTVTSPSGKVENVSGSFCANEIGFYEVEYSAQIAGINFSRKYTLDVTQKPASYTEYFHSVKGVSEIRADVSAPAYAKPGSGVAIYSNAQQCVFQYGNIIDLNTLTKNDQLISLLPLAGDGISPMDNFKVRLIDIYDSSNIIEYYVFSDYNPSLYDKEWTYASIIYKGKNYGIRRDGTFIKGRFGVDMSVHLRADLLEKEHMNGYGYGKAEWFCAQTDYLNKCFHVNAGFKYNVVKSHLLMDLSKSEYVGFGNEWSGFTTGEVYLQVEMNSSYGTCGMIVSEIAGESMSGELSDGRMPAGFFLDSEEDSQIPNAKVGLEYRVPEVSYYRDSLEGKVDNPEYSAKLYQIFLAPILMEEIPLTSGSSSKYSFIPTKTGNYKLVYSVTDKAGNTFSKEYKFIVEPNKTPNVQVDLPENLYVGEYLTIPQIKLSNMSRLTYEKTQIIYDGTDYSGRTGDVIMLNKAGEIKIRCLYEDYLGQELKFEKIYMVEEKDEPIISIVDNVPKYVLKGQSIVLPDFSAVTYKNGTAEQNIIRNTGNGALISSSTSGWVGLLSPNHFPSMVSREEQSVIPTKTGSESFSIRRNCAPVIRRSPSCSGTRLQLSGGNRNGRTAARNSDPWVSRIPPISRSSSGSAGR